MSSIEHRSIMETVKSRFWRHPWLYSAVAIALVFLILWASSLRSSKSGAVPVLSAAEQQGRIFQFVVDTLNEAEDSRVTDVAVTISERLNQWVRHLDDKQPWREDPFISEFFNANLTPQQRQMAGMPDFALMEFNPADGFAIQESLWLSQVAHLIEHQARLHPAQDSDPKLAQVQRLLDWTVRNIALEAEDDSVPYFPWQILLHGRGRVIDRAWIFTLLCRQAGFDAVMLGYKTNGASATGANEAETSVVKPWIPAVLINDKLYLFDHEYGMPVFNADGSIATLKDVIADESPLRAFDLPGRPYPVGAVELQSAVAMIEASPHFLTRRMFVLENHLVGRLRSGSADNPGRSSSQTEVKGKSHSVVLFTKPIEIAEALQQVPNITAVMPWGMFSTRQFQQAQALRVRRDDPASVQRKTQQLIARAGSEMAPFFLPEQHVTQSVEGIINLQAQEAMLNVNQDMSPEQIEEYKRRLEEQRRAKVETLLDVLLRARLRYFEGNLGGDRSASWFYQKARPSADQLSEMQAAFDQRAEELKAILANAGESNENRQRADMELQYNDQIVPGKRKSRELATYWLGLLHFQKSSFQEAVVYFSERFLDRQEFAQSLFAPMARYNLGRSMEEFANQKERELSETPTEDTVAQQDEINSLRERALALYENETSPLYVPQARARAAWFRQRHKQ
ncbi:MAG: hypothetical protein MPJ50_03315 [Pirellulales bacterium]|nr:hypothetical protein [Pirellulales bacterium]